jgi:hypothetical protein
VIRVETGLETDQGCPICFHLKNSSQKQTRQLGGWRVKAWWRYKEKRWRGEVETLERGPVASALRKLQVGKRGDVRGSAALPLTDASRLPRCEYCHYPTRWVRVDVRGLLNISMAISTRSLELHGPVGAKSSYGDWHLSSRVSCTFHYVNPCPRAPTAQDLLFPLRPRTLPSELLRLPSNHRVTTSPA